MSAPDDLHKPADRAATNARSGRAGVYDDRSDASEGGGAAPEKIGVYDRPASADRRGFSPVLIAIGAAVVIGVPLLIWAL